MNTTKGIFSHKTDEWLTPVSLFEHWNEVCNFTLDAASTDENALCEKHYTKETDGLSQSWKNERVWCNPPYSEVNKWVDKALSETRGYDCGSTFVVMLLPSRTDTQWFENIYKRYDISIKFIRGRLRFSGCNSSAPFASILVVFGFRNFEHYVFCKKDGDN